MKPDEQLDHALGQLDGPALQAAEAASGRDPALSERIDRLGVALRDLLDDGDGPTVPIGLAGRTLAFVADRKDRRQILDFVPNRVPFRWADVAVAAGILMAGLLTLLPAIKSDRDRMNQAECAFNLQQLGLGLANYATRHDHYPDVHANGPETPAGWYAMALDDESLLGGCQSLHCPCSGKCPKLGPKPDLSHMDYAYHIGYRDQPTGRAEPITPWLAANVPLLADQPPHDGALNILPGNSPNHGRRGQNVLWSDLHVQFHKNRRVSPKDDDLYLNQQSRPEAGLGIHDSALVPATFRIKTR